MTVTGVKHTQGKLGPSLLLTIDRRYKVFLNGDWVERFDNMFVQNGRIIFKYFGSLSESDKTHHIEFLIE